MGTQQHFSVEIKGIMHRTRRMAFRNIQCSEIMITVFDFRPFGNLKTNLTKILFNTLQSSGHRMQTAYFGVTTRQGDINGFSRQSSIHGLFSKNFAASFSQTSDFLLGQIHFLTNEWPFFSTEVTQFFYIPGNQTFFSQIFDPDVIQCFSIGRVFNRGLRCLNNIF